MLQCEIGLALECSKAKIRLTTGAEGYAGASQSNASLTP